MSDRIERIKERLQTIIKPVHLELLDESYKHAGHAGARQGGGHFDLLIISTVFVGQNAMQRHRMIYTALGDFIPADIHALSIKAYTPEEYPLN
ncbi:BolA/IbaG family iron-sulfur metabolism protein [Beggiatoa leptomitoformis]|uniref:BolA/IbaG family iron-sulfur metabolism protein n=2 Tax=Beggiatoa leptomitoformis TaxID=288004 RepID=A0A2N9YEI9_9GAMM|nr:BolA/IbaG family iron-sulfur metabolism protein [Beggiatoa leptomitoformis]AUI68903.1 BolA/IbaG family iron-sulfur metabolism protein [Beggiatoa leptomitoformis]